MTQMVCVKSLDAVYTGITNVISGNDNMRPKRANRGQGGVAEQLAKVGNQIRPDLQSQQALRAKARVNIPPQVPMNDMAPPPVKRRGTVTVS